MKEKYALLKNIFLSNFNRLSSPYRLTYALTYRCNLTCKICLIWKKRNSHELSIYEIKRFFKRLNNLCWLDLTGGEITLRGDVEDVIDIIIENSPYLSILHLSTNGQIPEKILSIAERILKHKRIVPIINVSLDGPERINDKLKGKTGAWRKSIETFNQLKTLPKGYYYLSYTISDYNLDCIRETFVELRETLPRFHFSYLHFNMFHNSSHYYSNPHLNCFDKKDLRRIRGILSLARCGNLVKYLLESVYLKGIKKYIRTNRNFIPCQALNSSCFLDPEGNIYPCGIYTHPIGNIRNSEYELDRIWRCSKTLCLREKILKCSCPGCWSPCEIYPAILGSIIKRGVKLWI